MVADEVHLKRGALVTVVVELQVTVLELTRLDEVDAWAVEHVASG